jgi:transposase-like protein
MKVSWKESFMTKKRKRRKPEQIVKLLQEGQVMLATGKSEAEVFQRLEITESTWQRWNKQFGGMKSDEAKRLRELEVENQRLKEMLAEAELDKRILKTALEGNY